MTLPFRIEHRHPDDIYAPSPEMRARVDAALAALRGSA